MRCAATTCILQAAAAQQLFFGGNSKLLCLQFPSCSRIVNRRTSLANTRLSRNKLLTGVELKSFRWSPGRPGPGHPTWWPLSSEHWSKQPKYKGLSGFSITRINGVRSLTRGASKNLPQRIQELFRLKKRIAKSNSEERWRHLETEPTNKGWWNKIYSAFL